MDHGVTLGLRRLAWLIEVRGLANRSEGFGGPGPVDKSEGFGWAGRAQGPSIKVRDLGGRAGPGPSTSGTHAQAHTISSFTLQHMARMGSLEE